MSVASLTRRLFLRNAAAGAAVAVTVAAPVAVEAAAPEPQKSAHEQAMWHMQELARLVREDGGRSSSVMLVKRNAPGELSQMMILKHDGTFDRQNDLFSVGEEA
jgi:hypothetical protein